MALDTLKEIIGNVDGAVDIFGDGARAFGNVTKGIASIKSLFDGPKSPSKVDVDRTIFEIERKVLDAEKANFALERALLEVQRQLAEANRQSSQLGRYHLIKFSTGDFAYELNPDAADGEPPHCVCAKCYEEGVRSILDGAEYLTCPRCKHSVALRKFNPNRN